MKAEDLFEPKLWQKLSDLEKTRLSNVYDKYRQMEELGFEPTPPDFVLAYIKKNKRNRPEKESESDLPPAKKIALDEETEAQYRISQSIKELYVSLTDDTDADLARIEKRAFGQVWTGSESAGSLFLDSSQLQTVPDRQTRKFLTMEQSEVGLNRETSFQTIASESHVSSANSSDTTSGELMNASKGFTLEIFNLGDDKTPVTRSKWNKRNDPETSSAGRNRYLMRNSARNKKYCYDSTTEEDKDDDIESSDKSESEDRRPEETSSEKSSEPESGEP